MCIAERWAWLALLGATACTADGAGPEPTLCATGTAVNLMVGEYAALDPTTAASGCTVFPANASATDSAEYLVVPQLATGDPGRTSSFQLLGDVAGPGAAVSAPQLAPAPTHPGAAERFHTFLRRGDERRFWGLAPAKTPRSAVPPRRAALGSPGLGSTRRFAVCANLDCSQFDSVTATARSVQDKIAIYVDAAAPAGLDSADLDSLAATFQTRLYVVDTTAFGRESDLDSNGVVLVLMTPAVNRLVSPNECGTEGFVTGYFLGTDLEPAFQSDARSNRGEIFYSLVADPGGSLSCAHTVDQVRRLLPVTFVHEFQHMISFNQHVLLRGGDGEALWLNEGLSHFAEELGGWSYGVGSPAFSRFTIGDVYNAYRYLEATGTHFLLASAGAGTLAERGAAWLFVRYLADRYAAAPSLAGWSAFTRGLLETSSTGAQNVADRTGTPFSVIVTRWALANWVSDLPGFTPPVELRYATWRLRTTYASLHAQNPADFPKTFPLTPGSGAARAVSLSGVLPAGSGVYHRALQAPGGRGFGLQFRSGSGAPLDASLVPRLSVVRIR